MTALPKFGIALSIHPEYGTLNARVVYSSWREGENGLLTQLEEFTVDRCEPDTNWSIWVRDVLVEAIERLKD